MRISLQLTSCVVLINTSTSVMVWLLRLLEILLSTTGRPLLYAATLCRSWIHSIFTCTCSLHSTNISACACTNSGFTFLRKLESRSTDSQRLRERTFCWNTSARLRLLPDEHLSCSFPREEYVRAHILASTTTHELAKFRNTVWQ